VYFSDITGSRVTCAVINLFLVYLMSRSVTQIIEYLIIGGAWKEAVLTSLKISSQNLPRGTEVS
jgi:hypothetical protein